MSRPALSALVWLAAVLAAASAHADPSPIPVDWNMRGCVVEEPLPTEPVVLVALDTGIIDEGVGFSEGAVVSRPVVDVVELSGVLPTTAYFRDGAVDFTAHVTGFVEANYLTFSGTVTFEDGTGRYDGATGTGTIEGRQNLVDLRWQARVVGTLVPPGP